MSYQASNLGYKMRYDWERPVRRIAYDNDLARQERMQTAQYYGMMVAKTMPKNIPARKNDLKGQMGYGNNSTKTPFGDKMHGGMIIRKQLIGSYPYQTSKENIKIYTDVYKKALENLTPNQMNDNIYFIKKKSDKYMS